MQNEFTKAQFSAVQNIYDYFNKAMFEGKLNNCLLNFSRMSKSYGFFAPNRWGVLESKEMVHEISLNPDHLTRDPKAVISTLVHEMVHLWQQDFGKPSAGYHNKEWAQKMKVVGLYPSSTGAEGGKETGKNCSHYIIEGGLYDVLYNEMPKDYLYPLVASPFEKAAQAKKASKNKTKYACPSCQTNIWGKPNLKVTCSDCDELFVSNESGENEESEAA
jgi:SprT-like family